MNILTKLVKVINSCETKAQLIYAQRYAHLAYKGYKDSNVLRILGTQLLMDMKDKLK